jgi:tripartite-type tricarboxylate transporter receptor subunit TctC
MRFPIFRKTILGACALAVAGNVSVASAADEAAQFPSKPVRAIVANAPGSLVDFVARLVAPQMGEKLGQTIVVENIAGAGGTIGTAQLVRSASDGYTVGLVSSNHAINPGLYKLPYDSAKDIAPISILGTSPMVLVVNPKNVQALTLQDLIKQAKAEPNKLNFGSAGVGTVGHLSAEMLAIQGDFKWLHIPYKGNDRFVADLLGGQIDAGFLTLAPALPLLKSGRLVALGVTTKDRAATLPDVPTVIESGFPEYTIDAWVALLAPMGTPDAIQKKLSDAAKAALDNPEIQEKLAAQGVSVVAGEPAESTRQVNADMDRLVGLVKTLGLEQQ